jgi:hypothetical protein
MNILAFAVVQEIKGVGIIMSPVEDFSLSTFEKVCSEIVERDSETFGVLRSQPLLSEITSFLQTLDTASKSRGGRTFQFGNQGSICILRWRKSCTQEEILEDVFAIGAIEAFWRCVLHEEDDPIFTKLMGCEPIEKGMLEFGESLKGTAIMVNFRGHDLCEEATRVIFGIQARPTT